VHGARSLNPSPPANVCFQCKSRVYLQPCVQLQNTLFWMSLQARKGVLQKISTPLSHALGLKTQKRKGKNKKHTARRARTHNQRRAQGVKRRIRPPQTGRHRKPGARAPGVRSHNPSSSAQCVRARAHRQNGGGPRTHTHAHLICARARVHVGTHTHTHTHTHRRTYTGQAKRRLTTNARTRSSHFCISRALSLTSSTPPRISCLAAAILASVLARISVAASLV